MNITLNLKLIEAFKKAGCKWKKINDMNVWGDRTCEVNLELVPASDLKILEKVLAPLPQDDLARRALKRIDVFKKLEAADTNQVVKKLEPLAQALKTIIRKGKYHWVFEADNEEGTLVPWYVSSVEYRPRVKDFPAHTNMYLKSIRRGEVETKTIQWNHADLRGKKTLLQLLADEDLFLETPEAIASYKESFAYYKEISVLTGQQFSATGTGLRIREEHEHWGITYLSMEVEGNPSKVVMDDEFKEASESEKRPSANPFVDATFWIKGVDEDADDDEISDVLGSDPDDDEEGNEAKPEPEHDETLPDDPRQGVLPVQPVVRVFDLRRHRFFEVNTDYLEAYQWKTDLTDKLVLDPDKKELVEILVTSAEDVMEDIIKGKTGGVIVMATGEPGTGKTLTAEVFSENIKAPLYMVQCSQLGMDIEAIEINLQKFLARAVRWGAILLIDEADVYVRARGTDIQQNAIVGVFLRVLEYYRGILFMTSNRATTIDDAIISRLTAHIRYTLPDKDSACRIWAIQAEQQQLEMSANVIKQVQAQFPYASGRNIKSLCKLARMMVVKRKHPVNLELFKKVSIYQDINTGKE